MKVLAGGFVLVCELKVTHEFYWSTEIWIGKAHTRNMQNSAVEMSPALQNNICVFLFVCLFVFLIPFSLLKFSEL